ncbi:uncharacterized protein F5891DRAFT_1183270 [Suillus fuscotomentosus]|uniref:Uncharacterized protein n=1 Tax=Suillus fuscotomentosus TaxID=1912939 RepID=A0AAD4EFJ9_9AGAM|nr:uncharacterized protein F5891DRAFT_1183270 [Suillus fuscotomentosus]KAG1905333.1 hypothetical protein F5891DRAFT_1183270 [Suillus fuscotomentosus]
MRLQFVDHFPSGSLLPVIAPSLAHIIEHFPMFTHEQYLDIVRAHAVRTASVDHKDYVRDLLRVHTCTHVCAPNSIVFRHLRIPRRDVSRLILPVPFAIDHHAQRAAAGRSTRSQLDDETRLQARTHNSQRHFVNYRSRSPDAVVAQDPDLPTIRTFEEKREIIKEWQHHMSLDLQRRGACAVCTYNVRASELKLQGCQFAASDASMLPSPTSLFQTRSVTSAAATPNSQVVFSLASYGTSAGILHGELLGIIAAVLLSIHANPQGPYSVLTDHENAVHMIQEVLPGALPHVWNNQLTRSLYRWLFSILHSPTPAPSLV